MGLPSTGKTSILNALLPTSAAPLHIAPPVPSASSAKSPQPTTKAPVDLSLDVGDEVTVGLIDAPGWDLIPEDLDNGEVEDMGDDDEIDQEKWDALEEDAIGDVMRRNLGRIDRIKEVLPLGQLPICLRR